MLDITSLWATVHQNKVLINQFLIALLVFVGGWFLGQITSPYFSSQPIVFEDRQCPAAASSGGTAAELVSLKDEGIAARSPSPQTAGATITEQGSGQFVASVNSTLFHHSSCAVAKRINVENQVWFVSAEEAQAAGFAPSKCAQEIGLK